MRLAVDPPRLVGVLSTAATIGLIVSVSVFAWRLFVLMKRRLLWRVRRKLILSYIFIGVVPSLLIVIFFLLGGVLIFMNVSAYLFKDGYDAMVDDVKLSTESAASEMSRSPESADQSFARIHRNASRKYPVLSFVYVPVPARRPARAARGAADRGPAGERREPLGERLTAGPWEHMPAPASIPAWLTREGMVGTIALPSPDGPGRSRAGHPRGAARRDQAAPSPGFVIADLPIGLEMVQKLQEQTRVRAGTASVLAESEDSPVVALATSRGPRRRQRRVGHALPQERDLSRLLRVGDRQAETREHVAQLPSGGAVSPVVGRPANRRRHPDARRVAILVLLVIATLFLIIEIVALSMGLALARSITSSIHELFMGTERVRHGDFAHRIDVYTNDQLGELAGSFNQMTGSIEGLLQTAAEKKRLEEELRIARVIQMSLLPRGPLDVPGLAVTALCVPAREVGGDYYDFFRLPGERLGVLIADVSGKGTSAALYMAELKGLVLALSQMYRVAAPAADRSEPDHLGAPRQPELHHDDVCRHRSAGRAHDVLPRGAHAAHLPAGPLRHRARRAGADAQAAWCSA